MKYSNRPLAAPRPRCEKMPSPHRLAKACAIRVSAVRENQLLAAANANNAENAGVRCANTNNRGTNTNANYGFPLFTPYGLRFCGNAAKPNNTIKPNGQNPATQKRHGWWRVLNPMSARAMQACTLAKEYEVKQRLVEGCNAASANVLHVVRHKAHLIPVYSYGA